MTSDDEFFFDYLASIPNDVKKYSSQVADSINEHVDHLAITIRDTLARQSWLPPVVKPLGKTAAKQTSSSPRLSTLDRIQAWVSRNRAWAAAIIAFVGTGALLIYGNKKLTSKKRKARRAGNGARKEIVVIAGSPYEPMTRSIADDLERRGFIIFITVTSTEEENAVRAEGREDIRPLWLDLTTTPSTPSDIHPSLHIIQSLITHPQAPMPGIQPHVCQLSGLVIIPSPKFPTGPIATIPASNWVDTINTRLLYPILTTQLLLPLLTLKNNSSSIILLSPSIQSSLSAPFATPEVTVTQGLSGFATSLRQELRLLQRAHNGTNNGIEVIEFKLGNIDLGRQFRNGHSQNTGTEVLTWQPQQRAMYGSTYLSSIDYRVGRSVGAAYGSPARELHFAIFDALAPASKSWLGRRKRKQSTVYVGKGSRTYSIVGNIVPSGLVGWMLGLRSGHPGPLADLNWDINSSGTGSETGWEKLG
ncbi:hypothetical protein AJ78_02408 [Emergomyces pasteurianus Ep9510]|uniref:DUF1776-domain-containing protein n=1 Tax=Emergomyces pasteurianus Ep9510 TaxID=1447872 RepID=A0A1J9QMU1_9EURO|nr:hypothetical protein AJ78_02408 [Emergomyces pasteurianus Ep9510]